MKKSPFIVLFCLLCLFSALNVNAQGSNDTVTVTPQKPTFLDSLHFDLYNASRCCCTRYYSKNVSVTDTTIMLSFQYDDSLCMLCDCFAAGSHTQFACGSQKAGKYGIYKAESMYCPPGTVCPLGPVMIKRVGEVTVYAPTSSTLKNRFIAPEVKSPVEIMLSSLGVILQLNLNSAQAVSVSVFSTNGGHIKTLLKDRFFSQGTHSFGLGGLPKVSGITLLKVQGESFSVMRVIKNIQ